MTVDGKRRVVVLTLKNLVVVSLEKGDAGRTVASTPWPTDYANNIPSPAVEGGSILVTSASASKGNWAAK